MYFQFQNTSHLSRSSVECKNSKSLSDYLSPGDGDANHGNGNDDSDGDDNNDGNGDDNGNHNHNGNNRGEIFGNNGRCGDGVGSGGGGGGKHGVNDGHRILSGAGWIRD